MRVVLSRNFSDDGVSVNLIRDEKFQEFLIVIGNDSWRDLSKDKAHYECQDITEY